MENTPKSEIEKILVHLMPSRFVYAPNYWQWFKHQQDHGLLPDEIRHCNSQLDLCNYLGVDIFSRNVYSNPEEYWFGGICTELIDDFELREIKTDSGLDKITLKEYRSSSGFLNERLIFKFAESTLVQDKFLVTDYSGDLKLLEHFVKSRRWIFNKERFDNISREVGENGIVIAGEFYSPLKMLHLIMGPVNTVYFLMEYPFEANSIMGHHEKAQLDCIKQAVDGGIKIIMAMDNLDTMFHPPDFVKEYSSSFYIKASDICNKSGARFFIHACGQQRDNLKLISSYGVDGLEGVASPPLGDIMPEEVMDLTDDNFIMTGGISAMETRDLKNREAIFKYVEELFRKMLPYKNRFIFSSSCNTAINTSWETIKHFRDAWLQYKDMK